MHTLLIVLSFLLFCLVCLYYVRIHHREAFEESGVRIGIAALIRKPIDLPLWLRYHRKFGVKKFYIRLEDSPGWEDFLKAQPDVWFEIAESDRQGNNFQTLMYRQVEFVTRILRNGTVRDLDWLFHIDCDELMHGSLEFLKGLSPDIKVVNMENAEAVFDENNMDTCFKATHFLRCGIEGTPCKSYVNGKSGGRVEAGVTLAGPHNFAWKGEYTGAHVHKVPFEILHVLHFDSCSFGAWAEKFRHMGKNIKDPIPFVHYMESIGAANAAFDVFKKIKMADTGKWPTYDTVVEMFRL